MEKVNEENEDDPGYGVKEPDGTFHKNKNGNLSKSKKWKQASVFSFFKSPSAASGTDKRLVKRDE